VTPLDFDMSVEPRVPPPVLVWPLALSFALTSKLKLSGTPGSGILILLLKPTPMSPDALHVSENVVW
jgi:hypothetical protein